MSATSASGVPFVPRRVPSVSSTAPRFAPRKPTLLQNIGGTAIDLFAVSSKALANMSRADWARVGGTAVAFAGGCALGVPKTLAFGVPAMIACTTQALRPAEVGAVVTSVGTATMFSFGTGLPFAATAGVAGICGGATYGALRLLGWTRDEAAGLAAGAGPLALLVPGLLGISVYYWALSLALPVN